MTTIPHNTAIPHPVHGLGDREVQFVAKFTEFVKAWTTIKLGFPGANTMESFLFTYRFPAQTEQILELVSIFTNQGWNCRMSHGHDFCDVHVANCFYSPEHRFDAAVTDSTWMGVLFDIVLKQSKK